MLTKKQKNLISGGVSFVESSAINPRCMLCGSEIDDDELRDFMDIKLIDSISNFEVNTANFFVCEKCQAKLLNSNNKEN